MPALRLHAFAATARVGLTQALYPGDTMNPLALWALRKALERPCGARIPRIGNGADQVDCFVVAIDKDDDAYLVILGIDGNELVCLEHDGNRYAIERKIPVDDFTPRDYRITHFYGADSVIYSGLTDFALNWIFKYPYFKIFLHHRLEGLDQYFFNKRKLVTKQRTDLLKFMAAEAMNGNTEFDSLDLMTKLYTIKWILHPNAESERDKLDFFLSSLVDTGELKYQNNKYVLTGLALKAIEDSEQDDQKHVENVKLQRRMLWLTVVIVFLTIVQTGLIKLPTVFNFSSYSIDFSGWV